MFRSQFKIQSIICKQLRLLNSTGAYSARQQQDIILEVIFATEEVKFQIFKTKKNIELKMYVYDEHTNSQSKSEKSRKCKTRYY
jgi:hypothetical protein